MKSVVRLLLILSLAFYGPASANLPGAMGIFPISNSSSSSPAVTFVSQALTTLASCTTCTITSADFGAGGRITASIAYAASNARSLSTVTLNGVSATIQVTAPGGNTSQNVIIVSASSVPAGTGNIVLTFSGSHTNPNFLHAIYITQPTLGTTATNTTSVTALSLNMGTVNSTQGIVAGYYSPNAGSTVDFNGGVTTDIRTSLTGTNPAGHGSLANGSGGTVTVTSNTVSSQTILAAAAVFGP